MTTTKARSTKKTRASTRKSSKTLGAQTMRAAAIDRFGEPEAVKIHTLPVPEIGADEVRIAIDTASVETWDAEMRGGWWPEGKPRFPLVLGTDGSGVISAVGSRVRRLAVGDEVYAYAFLAKKGGFHAEEVAVAATHVAHLPEGLDLLHAGAIPAVALTALQGVDDTLHVKRGEDVLIFGASGAVGRMAIQFAKLRGARVLAAASGKDGVMLAVRLGADFAVDGKKDDVAAAARRFAPNGLDAILALAGGTSLEHAIGALRSGGRVAHPNGVEPKPKKHRGVAITAYDAQGGMREFQRLSRALESGAIEIPIAAEYSLARASKAHAKIESGHVLGQVVLRVREP